MADVETAVGGGRTEGRWAAEVLERVHQDLGAAEGSPEAVARAAERQTHATAPVLQRLPDAAQHRVLRLVIEALLVGAAAAEVLDPVLHAARMTLAPEDAPPEAEGSP